jgi:hypothetical protein
LNVKRYVKVVEKSPILGGVSITASNPESESWDFILSELCKVVGVKDVTYVAPSNRECLQFIPNTSY